MSSLPPSEIRNRLLVMKFGGTSVGSGDAIRRVAGIIVDQLDQNPVVVTSAMSGVTDDLLELTEQAAAGEEEICSRRLRSLREQHLKAAREIAPAHSSAWVALNQELASLEIATGRLLEDPPSRPRVEGRLAGWGELLAVLLVTGALQARGVSALACLEPLVVVRSELVGAGAAVPQMAMTREAVAEFAERHQAPGTGSKGGEGGSKGGEGGSPGATIVVVPGFICRTTDGRISTLGRGGSDYSATILAAALGVSACWIYTDVDGVLTADPRIVPEARVLPRISAATAGRLSHCGARVLHPRSVAPVARTGIELRVRNTFSPANAGTLIADADLKTEDVGAADLRSHPIVAGRRSLCAVGLTGPGLPEIPHLFGRLCRAALSVGAEIVQSPQPVPGHDPLVIIDAGDAPRVTGALTAEFAVELEQALVSGVVAQTGLALCSVVGDIFPAAFPPASAAQAALAGAGIRWLHQSVSAEVVSFVLAESQLDSAIRCIHADLVRVWSRQPAEESAEPGREEESVRC
jgi:aspartokinase